MGRADADREARSGQLLRLPLRAPERSIDDGLLSRSDDAGLSAPGGGHPSQRADAVLPGPGDPDSPVDETRNGCHPGGKPLGQWLSHVCNPRCRTSRSDQPDFVVDPGAAAAPININQPNAFLRADGQQRSILSFARAGVV